MRFLPKSITLTILVTTAILLALTLQPAAAQGPVQHVVQPGETLYRISLRYGVTMDALSSANGLYNPNQLVAWTTLTIPSGEVNTNTAPAETPAEPAGAPVYHTVGYGETLGSIARLYGKSWTDLAALNNITNPNRVLLGQTIIVDTNSAVTTAPVEAPAPVEVAAAPAVEPAPASSTATVHIVQSGEHLASIARQYGISWSVLAQANGIIDPNRVIPGQHLNIPGAGTVVQQGAVYTAVNAPAPTISDGKQIVVHLSAQQIHAYENGQLVRTVTVSTGLPGTPTVQGDYTIYWKLPSQTMSGPGYYLPGVPWVMYFYQGYAIHGTYWHSNFGQPMSHGCVNLPTPDASWFYTFAEVGTPVHVVY